MKRLTIGFFRPESGFSLIEMAMVLVIIGTLMGGVLVAVSQTTENSRRATARNQLREIETALSRIEIYGGRMDARQMAQIGQDTD